MAVDKQREYNSLRDQLDAVRNNSYLRVNDDDEYRRQIDFLEKKLAKFKPKTRRQIQPGAGARVVAPAPKGIMDGLVYSEDPQSPFQKALKKVAEISGAEAADAAAKRKFDELQKGYESEKKDKKDKAKTKRDADKADALEQKRIRDNAIRKVTGLQPLPDPSIPKDNTVKKDTPKVKIDDAELELGWGAFVPMIKETSNWRGGKPIQTTTRYNVTEATALFNSDPKIRKQVMSILSNGGRNVDGLSAYLAWENAVQKSMEVSRGGKGYVVTPMEVLQSLNGTSSGPTTSTHTQLNEFKSAEVSTLIDSIFQNTLGMNPTAAQKGKYLKQWEDLAKKGTVTTTTTNGRNTTSSTKGGFDSRDSGAQLQKDLETKPQFANDLKERKTLDFNSAISKLMSRSING